MDRYDARRLKEWNIINLRSKGHTISYIARECHCSNERIYRALRFENENNACPSSAKRGRPTKLNQEVLAQIEAATILDSISSSKSLSWFSSCIASLELTG